MAEFCIITKTNVAGTAFLDVTVLDYKERKRLLMKYPGRFRTDWALCGIKSRQTA
ncbi:MAG TPA: hypothetical protein VGL27_04145 [Negativicutes bacterium]